MPEPWKSFFARWLVTTAGVLLAAGIIDGVRADTVVALLSASLLLGILNAFLRPILLLLALPLLVVTLGLFTLVINALLLYLVSFVVKGFHVADFWSAIKGAILVSLVSVIANVTFGKTEVRTELRTGKRPPGSKPPPDTGSGPVIDI